MNDPIPRGEKATLSASNAFRFVLILGIVNLFADVTYEGASSYLAIFLSSLFAPLVFFGNFALAIIGMILWGVGFSAQDTLFKSIIAGLLPEGRRNLAFGLFYTGYGTGWLVGSVTTGLLYGRSLLFLVAFSVVIQLVSLPVFFVATKRRAR